MVAITMSPVAMSAWQAASACASLPHSSAACSTSSRLGSSQRSSASARAAAPDR